MADPTPPGQALQADEIDALQGLLDSLPQPLEPFDSSSLDGFLCGVVLQPVAPPASRWLAHVADVDGRPTPAGVDLQPLHAMVLRRHAELQQAIDRREWFDPWIFEFDAALPVAQAVLPWVAGFAAAQDLFPELMQIDDARLMEPLALLYLHFDPDDLEDAAALRAVIDTVEPPADLAEAVQDIVRSVMLIADVAHQRHRVPAMKPRRR
jgi:uncharacterized protein